jgi:outer membrane lipoprotein-sorting protein
MNRLLLGIIFLLQFNLNSSWAIPTAKEVMLQNESARKLQEVQSDATLVTGLGEGSEKTKTFTWWRKLDEDQVHYQTLTRFHTPAEVRGEGILFLEHDQGENEVLLYLPNFKKIRRVESQQQSGSFMGSEFSYSDIASPHVEDFQYKMIQAVQECGSEGTAKLMCYVIEAVPATEMIRNRMGYAKLALWVRQDNFMEVKGDYYDLKGDLIKKMEASEIQLVDSSQKKWMAHRLRIVNERTQRYTLLQFKNVKVNHGISKSLFTQQNLQLVR